MKKTAFVATCISQDMVEKIDFLAKQEKLSRSGWIKKCILNSIDNFDNDLLLSSMKTLMNKVDTYEKLNKERIMLFANLFTYFLGNWFSTHPIPKTTEEARKGLSYRDQFLKQFVKTLNETDLFESIVANISEGLYD